ncbi:PP2C family protein-serine/threonine phosphatase [Butyrivibrio sp. AE2032]|uniref:PP2C family protein-serine/threonine phosphatase n=1 Tax=Butyrivibrio sp. AE2032 TaxID=1458463 RepID=UPI00054F0213|nr:protein phosphatase 2C domain-containing protein [Butyrivibrio sp. AE2032]
MNFLISAVTDIGLTKSTNQDCYFVSRFKTKQGNVVLAVLCDGMGGLSKGEIASSSVINAFKKWSETRLPQLLETGFNEVTLQAEWNEIAVSFNRKIMDYARSFGTNMGTTLVAMLLTETYFFIINVGDSRVYEISNQLRVLTTDQTVVAREVELGNLTPEEAERDPRRSVLLQCIGASDEVIPDFFMGNVMQDAVYMLCSDGFRHEITPDEIYSYMNASVMTSVPQMQANMQALVETNKQRQERDNITVIGIRTYAE